MVEGQAQGLLRNTVLLALFLLPLLYVGEILAVAVHEILGHGLAAVALGGTFDGFVLKWDAMGWAYTSLPAGASATDTIVLVAAGVTATTVIGLVFLVCAYVFKRRVDIRLCVLVLSFACLMEGIPYVLWNSYHPRPPGDIGTILTLRCAGQVPHGSVLRIVLLIVSGIMFLAVTFLQCALIFQGLEQALLAGERLRPHARFRILLLFLAIPGAAGWFMFDWDQLAPGIGLLPCVVGAASIVVSTIVLYRFSLKPNSEIPGLTPTGYHILVSWGFLVLTVVLTLLWFQKGVRWG